MRIQSIEAIPIAIPLKPERRMISALGRQDVSRFTLVRLITDDGLEGAGEATVTPAWSGETARGAQAIIENLFAPALIGLDPTDIPELERRLDALAVGNWFAKAAIEMACWDVVGRGRGMPVYELFGGPCRDLTIKSRFSLGAYEPSVAAARAAQRVADGFDVIKIKVGTDPDQDIERVRAVRDAVGSQVTLTIDANGGWSFATAVRCLEAMKECGIAVAEQPLPRGDHLGLHALKDQCGLTILADESCFDDVDSRQLIEGRCCDALTLYPGKQAGILRAFRIAKYASEHSIPCTIGSNLEWDVGTAAMLHLVVACPNMHVERLPGDCLGPSYHEFSIACEPIVIVGPFTTTPDRPGLGVEVDWSLVQTHRIDRA